MTRAMPTTLVALFLASTVATVVHAGECEGYWPTPDECFPDILCEEYFKYWDLRRSVVHIEGPDFLGTGVLINNANCHTNGQDCGAPYVLTANHVASGGFGVEMSTGEMADLEGLTAFTFGLEAAWCGGPTAGGAVALVGASIVAHSPEKDLILLQLTTSLPAELGAYFVGWDPGPLNQALSISHPCGAPKRIAISEFGTINSFQTMGRSVYDVYLWQEGAVAAGSSGAPLLELSTGKLKGIFTDAVQAGALACSNPNADAQDRFTALSSVLDFLPTGVDGGLGYLDHFDSNEGAPVLGTVEDSNYYGEGTVHKVVGKYEVLLLDGFHAAPGSTITVTIEP